MTFLLSDIEEINEYDTIFDSNDIVYLSKEEIQHFPGDIFCKLWSKISGKELRCLLRRIEWNIVCMLIIEMFG